MEKIGRTDKGVPLREAGLLFVKNGKNCAKRRKYNVFLHFLQQKGLLGIRRIFDRKSEENSGRYAA